LRALIGRNAFFARRAARQRNALERLDVRVGVDLDLDEAAADAERAAGARAREEHEERDGGRVEAREGADERALEAREVRRPDRRQHVAHAADGRGAGVVADEARLDEHAGRLGRGHGVQG